MLPINLNIKGHLNKLYQLMSDLKQNILQRVDENHAQKQLEGIVTDLELVVSTTEVEVEKILNQIDILVAIAAVSEPEVKQKLDLVTLAICEACCFQDINGQRITRVVHSLGKISQYLAFIQKKDGEVLNSADFCFAEKDAAAELLQGPKAPNEENQQDLVDSFFETDAGK